MPRIRPTDHAFFWRGDVIGRHQEAAMNLGSFSVSLAVKDLSAARGFYEQLGFRAMGGKPEEHWLILENGDATIGLFEGMFEQNILTFNPPDVRAIQRQLKQLGMPLLVEADETTTGATHLVLVDPDGNQLLLDQFD
jgi:catechol 2,3-dioxygenase-like lactoylglutathione lyase family enzyme